MSQYRPKVGDVRYRVVSFGDGSAEIVRCVCQRVVERNGWRTWGRTDEPDRTWKDQTDCGYCETAKQALLWGLLFLADRASPRLAIAQARSRVESETDTLETVDWKPRLSPDLYLKGIRHLLKSYAEHRRREKSKR